MVKNLNKLPITFIVVMLSATFHKGFSQSNTYYYYPAYSAFYAVEQSKWFSKEKNHWVLSDSPPAQMPVITVEKNNLILFTYNGPLPFIYHLTLHDKTAPARRNVIKFSVKTTWENKKGDTLKVKSVYTGKSTREFNK